jgi:DNA-binding response OmpR family regulator
MGKKILVVDDDKHVPRLSKTALERAGYAVLVATDGMEALSSIERERPSLLLLDIAMPNMDGFETLRRLKSAPATCSIRIVIVTARDGDADIKRAWQAGADGYLIKPFAPDHLVAMVKTVLNDLSAGEQRSGLWPETSWQD